VIRAALLAGVLLLAAGCVSSRTQSAYRITGDVQGQPVALVVQGASAGSAGVDFGAVVQSALAGVRGDLASALTALHARAEWRQERSVALVDGFERLRDAADDESSAPLYAAGGSALLALLAALAQSMRTAAAHKRDADDAWDRLVPPPSSKVPHA